MKIEKRIDKSIANLRESKIELTVIRDYMVRRLQ